MDDQYYSYEEAMRYFEGAYERLLKPRIPNYSWEMAMPVIEAILDNTCRRMMPWHQPPFCVAIKKDSWNSMENHIFLKDGVHVLARYVLAGGALKEIYG